MDNEIKVATWNTRTIWGPGAKQNLKKVLEKSGVVIALQEIRWKWVKSKFYISIICARAPTDEVKDFFYEQLDKAYSTIPAYGMKLVLWDFNSKVGKDDITRQE